MFDRVVGSDECPDLDRIGHLLVHIRKNKSILIMSRKRAACRALYNTEDAAKDRRRAALSPLGALSDTGNKHKKSQKAGWPATAAATNRGARFSAFSKKNKNE
jgi:hypothetical protein